MENLFTSYDLAEGIFYYGVVFFLTICFVIFVHELGHYAVARYYGVRIPKFSIGFGRELFGFNDSRGTRWCLSAIPLGGYVSIYGDVDRENPLIWDEEKNEARLMREDELAVAFCRKTIAQRSLIVAAGPLMNIALTLLVMISLYMSAGIYYTKPYIYAVGKGSAAHEAGFQIGDQILRMDGVDILDISKIYDQTYENAGKSFVFDVMRGEEVLQITLAPEEVSYTDTKGVERKHGRTGMVNLKSMKLEDILSVDGVDTVDKSKPKPKGDPDIVLPLLLERLDKNTEVEIAFRADQRDAFFVRFPSAYNAHLKDGEYEEKDDFIYLYDEDEKHYRQLGFFEAVSKTVTQLYEGTVESYKIIAAVINRKSNEQVFSGVADISQNIGKAAKGGLYDFFLMVAMLSFMIAVINLLPIPVFDGGYLVFFLIEAIRGKPLPQKIQSYAMILGLVLIGGIMIFANISDLIQLFD